MRVSCAIAATSASDVTGPCPLAARTSVLSCATAPWCSGRGRRARRLDRLALCDLGIEVGFKRRCVRFRVRQLRRHRRLLLQRRLHRLGRTHLRLERRGRELRRQRLYGLGNRGGVGGGDRGDHARPCDRRVRRRVRRVRAAAGVGGRSVRHAAHNQRRVEGSSLVRSARMQHGQQPSTSFVAREQSKRSIFWVHRVTTNSLCLGSPSS